MIRSADDLCLATLGIPVLCEVEIRGALLRVLRSVRGGGEQFFELDISQNNPI